MPFKETPPKETPPKETPPKEMSIKEFLAPANVLSLSRIPLAVWIVILLQSETLSSTRVAILVLCFAGLTDLLDGIFARRAEVSSGKKNRYGIILDPLADKIFAIVLIVGLIAQGSFPLWLAVLILSRDIVIMIAGLALARKYQIVLPSNLPGKYYFVSLAFLLAGYIAKFKSGIALLEPLTLALWVVSSAYYVRIFARTKAGRQDQEDQSGGALGDAQPESRTGVRLRVTAFLLACLALAFLFVNEDPLKLW